MIKGTTKTLNRFNRTVAVCKVRRLTSFKSVDTAWAFMRQGNLILDKNNCELTWGGYCEYFGFTSTV